MIVFHTPTQQPHSFKLPNRSDSQFKNILRSLPLAKQCQYFGERLTADEVKANQLAGCRSCNNTINVFHCNLPGQKKFNDGPYTRGAECMSCTEYLEKPNTITDISTHKTIRFDHTNLHPEIPGIRFNCSIIESGEGYIFSSRTGWSGSRIILCRLDKNFQPIPNEWQILKLSTKGTRGHEDARLFRLNGFLHLMIVYYGGRKTTVRYARINEPTLQVEDEFFPITNPRRELEKNHSYFDYQGIAHCVYETTNQHRILRIEGSKTEWAAETPFKGHYSGGPIRGGASPVLHDGYFWHFTHGVTTSHSGRRYNIGVTKFRAEPPFDIVAYSPMPLVTAEESGNWCIFPCGAVKVGDKWAISMGVDDKHCEIRFYDMDWVESQLVNS
jgi:predicted GH43/DUF377 family glycosyl hydrolase